MEIIKLIDIRSSGPIELVRQYPTYAVELIKAARRTLWILSDIVSHVALPYSDRVSRKWLAETNNPYLSEIDECAQLLKLKGVHSVNVCFEWGCTSAVYSSNDAQIVTRVLDWVFPKLGEYAVVALQTGQAGDFYNITWPGVTGIFQGLAPGRFSAVLNQGPMRRHNLTIIGDWIKNRKSVFASTGIPPAHLLRQVYEQARNYKEAKEMLCFTPIALPAIYTIGGILPGEGCVVERTENDYAVRPLDGGRVCATNHFVSSLNDYRLGWRPRPMNSAGRLSYAESLSLTDIDKEFTWFKPPIAAFHSRLVSVSNPSSGSLSVFGTHGAKRVTQVLDVKYEREFC